MLSKKGDNTTLGSDEVASRKDMPGEWEHGSETRPDGTLNWSIFMARTQAGDRDAYRRLLQEMTPYLRAVVSRRIGNRQDMEDTVQDILLTVHKVRHTYDPARPFGPWVVAIANRRITDTLRRHGRILGHEDTLESVDETFPACETNLPEHAAEARNLRAFVERLPTAQQQAVRLLKLEELPLEQASALSGMSVVALKVALHRALKSLRKLMEQKVARHDSDL